MKKIICVCMVCIMSLGMVACAKETTTKNNKVDNESTSVTEENSTNNESSSTAEEKNNMKYLYDCKIITEWNNAKIVSLWKTMKRYQATLCMIWKIVI